ncbi:MAG: hypothetical protein ACFFG0_17950 [Candidatus Thorarchaeota archaeon]
MIDINFERGEGEKRVKLFVNQKKQSIQPFNNINFFYLGSVKIEPRTQINNYIDYLKKNHFYVRKLGQISYGNIIHLYIREKPIKIIRLLFLSKKELKELIKLGINEYEKRKYIKLYEGNWKFYGIRKKDNKIIFFNKSKPLINVSINDLNEELTERQYYRGGLTYFYIYNGKKYLQIERFNNIYEIWTRDRAKIYPYEFQNILLKKAKSKGLKKDITNERYIGKM